MSIFYFAQVKIFLLLFVLGIINTITVKIVLIIILHIQFIILSSYKKLV